MRAVLAAAVMLLPGIAGGADIAAGQALARAVCAECHWVEPEPEGGFSARSTAFRDIAAGGHSEISLRAFLGTPHAEMPNFVLSPDETGDIVAYILSLRAP